MGVRRLLSAPISLGRVNAASECLHVTHLQYISRQEQMEAHRRDFIDWWNRNVKEAAEKNPPEIWVLQQLKLWRQWKDDHGL